jgi:hypothetical protein
LIGVGANSRRRIPQRDQLGAQSIKLALRQMRGLIDRSAERGDGNHRLVGQPVILTSGHGPLFEATRDSAVRALLQAQP